MQLACDAYPGLIGVLEPTRTYPVSNLRHRWSESLCGKLDPAEEASLRHVTPLQVSEQFADARQWHQLILGQLDGQRAQV